MAVWRTEPLVRAASTAAQPRFACSLSRRLHGAAALQPQGKRMQRFEGRINAAPVSKVRVRGAHSPTNTRVRFEAAGAYLRPFALVQRDVLDVSDAISLPGAVANSVRESARRESAGRVRHVEKADRATVEQALDPRTRLVRGAVQTRATTFAPAHAFDCCSGALQDAEPRRVQLD